MLKLTSQVRDEATPLLQRLHASLAPEQRRPLMAVAGKTLERVLREHFKQRNLETNTKRARKGWPKQNFWAREVRDNTHLAEVTAQSATVAIASRPFRQKFYGGTIRPGPGKKALAIPLTRDTYGKRAASAPIPGLFVWRNPKKNKAYLAASIPDGTGTRLKIYYRLVRSVTQRPDPRALPQQSHTAKAIDHAITRHIRRIKTTQ